MVLEGLILALPSHFPTPFAFDVFWCIQFVRLVFVLRIERWLAAQNVIYHHFHEENFDQETSQTISLRRIAAIIIQAAFLFRVFCE